MPFPWQAILIPFIHSISPTLKQGIKEGVEALEAKAKETDNKADDVAVGVLRVLVSVFVNFD